MSTPEDRSYSASHEWHLVNGDTVTIGITKFAADQLTDVTFAEMKSVGTTLKAGDAIGEVESVKTTSDVYCHVDGEIVEVNGELEANPGVVSDDPYGSGWLVKVKMSSDAGLSTLVDAKAYDAEHAS
ncbi:MAG: glycine cleavage system protein H [Phycisphaerae bacterium]|nr:glycine cleavage system protein H [Phycisphaerae bacterium]